jgi:hypothetical protein
MAEHFLKMEHTPALSEIVNGKGMAECVQCSLRWYQGVPTFKRLVGPVRQIFKNIFSVGSVRVAARAGEGKHLPRRGTFDDSPASLADTFLSHGLLVWALYC